MNSALKRILSPRVVIGFPEQRLAYLADKIAEARAEYCAVLESQTLRFLGLFRIADVASTRGSENKILLDLLSPEKSIEVLDETPIPLLERVLAKAAGVVPVIDTERSFIGIVTRESYSEWRLHEERKKTRALEKQIKSDAGHSISSTEAEEMSSGVIPFEKANRSTG